MNLWPDVPVPTLPSSGVVQVDRRINAADLAQFVFTGSDLHVKSGSENFVYRYRSYITAIYSTTRCLSLHLLSSEL